MKGEPDHLALETFLPYRLSILSNTVSGTIAKLYQDRFGLSILEWRALAVIGRFAPMSANQVAERTAMDKVQVSRALQRLVTRGLVNRKVDKEDRRRSVLTLSRKGSQLVKKITPLALEVEQELLSALSKTQLGQLNSLLNKLGERADDLARQQASG